MTSDRYEERQRIAEAIFVEEQKIREKIVQDPTNPRLNGALSALQCARDIATGLETNTDDV